jgi:hypothetical protein
MTPKEKAIELVGKYSTVLSIQFSKEFALIAVDELIKFAYNYTDYNEKSTKEYLEKVKKEIENL